MSLPAIAKALAPPDWSAIVAAELARASGHKVTVQSDLSRRVGPHSVMLSKRGVHVWGALSDADGQSISLIICPNPNFKNGSCGYFERWYEESDTRSALDAYDGGLARLLRPFIQ
jgi:hypothetical protein